MIYNYFSGNINVIEYSHRCAISSAILVFCTFQCWVAGKVLVDPSGSLQKNWIKFWLSGLFVAVVFALLAELCWKNVYC